MSSYDYRLSARNSLRGYWGISILVTLVAAMLGAGSGVGSPLFGSSAASSAGNSTAPDTVFKMDWMTPEVAKFFAVVFSIMLLYSIVTAIFGGAVKLGLITYNIDLAAKRREPALSTLFSRFSIFGKAWLLQFAMVLFTVLWSLLFVIPGIIAAYRYAMAPYLLAENPELGVMEAIRLSKQMMNGNKMRLFILELSFIGWYLLCGLTCGIAYLWVNPYRCAAEAAFFLDISKSNPK